MPPGAQAYLAQGGQQPSAGQPPEQGGQPVPPQGGEGGPQGQPPHYHHNGNFLQFQHQQAGAAAPSGQYGQGQAGMMFNQQQSAAILAQQALGQQPLLAQQALAQNVYTKYGR